MDLFLVKIFPIFLHLVKNVGSNGFKIIMSMFLPIMAFSHYKKFIYNYNSSLSNITPENTFFIQCLLWNTAYSHIYFQPIIKSLFLNINSLHHICLVIPPGISTHIYGGDMILKKYFKRYSPLELLYADKKQMVYCCERENTVPKMKIRRAV